MNLWVKNYFQKLGIMEEISIIKKDRWLNQIVNIFYIKNKKANNGVEDISGYIRDTGLISLLYL